MAIEQYIAQTRSVGSRALLRVYDLAPRIKSPVTLNHSSCPAVSHKQDERGNVGALL